ncbi:MAG TPA: STAS domain-containing protein [Candidatus Tectomicrobia bacterium]
MTSAALPTRQVGPVTLIHLGSRLTTDTAALLHLAVTTSVAEGRKELVLECEEIAAVDSQGLGMLVRQWVSVERQGGRLKLVKLSPTLRQALQLTRLLDVIPSFDDISAALRSF